MHTHTITNTHTYTYQRASPLDILQALSSPHSYTHAQIYKLYICVCVYIYIYIHIYIYIYIHTDKHAHTEIHIHTSGQSFTVCRRFRPYIYTRMHKSIRDIYMHAYIHTYIYIYIWTHAQIHKYTQLSFAHADIHIHTSRQAFAVCRHFLAFCARTVFYTF